MAWTRARSAVRGVWGRFLDDLGKGLKDLGRSLEVKTGGSNPKTSKTRISLFNWKFPYFSYRKTRLSSGQLSLS